MTDLRDEGLNYLIQYRIKDQADRYDPWHTMAAFDVLGAAEKYFRLQESATWEYQMVDLETGAITAGKLGK